MLNRKLSGLIAGVCTLNFLLAGCGKMSINSEFIQAPKVLAASNDKEGDSKLIASKFLPQGMVFSPLRDTSQKSAIIERDIDSDGKKEIIFTFKASKDPYVGGIIVLKKYSKGWKVILSDYGEAKSVYSIQYANITGAKNPELLVNYFIGGSAGKELNVFRFNGKYQLIAKQIWNRMEIQDMPNEKGKKDGKQEIALWIKDTGTIFMTEVLRYEDKGLVIAKDVYPYYYKKKVIPYYENMLKEAPKEPIILYYLAEAQYSAGSNIDALQSLKRCKEYRSKLKKGGNSLIYPTDKMMNILEGKIYYGLNQYDKAIKYLSDELEEINKTKDLSDLKDTSDDDNLYDIYLNLGRIYEKLGKVEEAKECYNNAVKIAKKMGTGYTTWGVYQYFYEVNKHLKGLK